MEPGTPNKSAPEVVLTTVEELYNWGRKNSLWPLQFGLACCAIEMIAASMARFDIARFGAEVFRPSPRQADLMIVSGTVTKKMAPQVVRLFPADAGAKIRRRHGRVRHLPAALSGTATMSCRGFISISRWIFIFRAARHGLRRCWTA